MEKVFRQEFRLGVKSIFTMILTLAVFLVLSVYVFQWLHENIREVVREEDRKNITNISELNSDAVYRELSNRQILLQSMADSLSDREEYDVKNILKKMRRYAENYNFYNMGVLTEDGVLYTTSGEVVDVSEGDTPYKDAMSGRAIISKSFLPTDGGNRMVNLLTEPVYDGGRLMFILTGTYRSADLAQTLNISALDGKGFSFLIDAEGRAVIYPRKSENELYLRLLKFVNNSEDILPSKGGARDTGFRFEEENYYAHFEKIAINDWYLMTCAKEEDVFSGAGIILDRVRSSMVFIWVQVWLAIVGIVYVYIRFQGKAERVVFEDKLLRGKNFEYLRIYFGQIPEEERVRMAFFVLDVDKFKEFNFIYGSKKGDYLLKYIYKTFKKILPEDQIYRYTADQFAGLLYCGNVRGAEKKVRVLLDHASDDIRQGSIQPFVLSIGICMLKDYDDIRTVYSDAMIAKNTVKGNHVQKYAFYDECMRRERLKYMSMESAFQEAVANGEFQVYYQPKFDMRTGEMIGAEALARWKKPDGTMISPSEFVPCFEANGQIILLDELMLENVCRQMDQMKKEGLPILQVSVNLSRVQLKYPGISQKISYMMQSMHIDPNMLAIEITESALYDDTIPLKQIVGNLHDLGCQVNMDDYGTGISSLSALANISFDVIKLDKSFIDKIGNKKMEEVIRSSIRLSADLGIEMIAEGVEEKKQIDWLIKNGCNYAQGFYYSMPVSGAEYRRLLRRCEKRSS
ncbi:MAG: GGDEF domain-containing protein [Eubacteriales bacterium]|nr:GGDEF domain-containing protein [Eubacteriales bacterium]